MTKKELIDEWMLSDERIEHYYRQLWDNSPVTWVETLKEMFQAQLEALFQRDDTAWIDKSRGVIQKVHVWEYPVIPLSEMKGGNR